VIKLKQELPTVELVPRAEHRNVMTSIHSRGDGRKLVAVKGSPGEVLELCSRRYRNGETLPLTESDRQAIEAENETMAGRGLRVLAGAYKAGDREPDDDPRDGDLIWLGLIGMADPIRAGVEALIADLHGAGIDTVMLTGDQSPTAYAIGKQLHLSRNGRLEIVDSTHLAQVDPDSLKKLCERVHIFARISPAHKLQIVRSLQAAGKVVAMTGDGVNDAPALKAADIGIAMGHSGTDVAREVADVVLADDALATTIAAVSQGRTIYNNIRKSVHFLLSTNLSEILVVLSANAAGVGQPLNAMQLLWLNLVTDIFPGLALALEPPEPDVLQVPPRDPEDPIIKAADFRRIAFESSTITASVMGAYAYGLSRYGMGAQSSTIAFMSLVFGQLLHSLSCRSSKRVLWSDRPLPPNPALNGALMGSIALQLLSAIVPGLRGAIGVTRLSLLDSAAIAGSAALPLLVNELTKRDPSQPLLPNSRRKRARTRTPGWECNVSRSS
ncbi:MAG: HAD-IC family P-type ATPase, partial [Cyanobacteria bacterium J06639_1]